MMAVHIRVRDHIAELAALDDAGFDEYVKRLKHRLSRSNPVAVLTRGTIDRATNELQTTAPREPMLQHLLQLNCANEAEALLRRLTNELPPIRGRLTCHLLPASGEHGTGNCFGDDRLLVGVPTRGDALTWLGFVMVHEYSHTQRGYAIAPSTSVRDHLVFEGLAMVLAETFASKPQPYSYDEVTAEQEEEFWQGVDVEARGLDAYRAYMSTDAAYEVGARIIRGYLDRQGISVTEAHRRTNDELYWNSGYGLLR